VKPLVIPPEAFTVALTNHTRGAFTVARDYAQQNLDPESKAKFFMLIGDDLAAAEILHPNPRRREITRLWTNLAAIRAGNTVALEALGGNPGSLDVYDTAFLLRALAAQQQFERLIALIDQCRTRWQLPAWYAARLRAELLVDAPSEQGSTARALLHELAKSGEVPSPHRAEIWFNIGELAERENPDAAQATYRCAIELNPELDLQGKP
jgi:tetratricopeptide (TPR) repeat protein